MRDLGKPAIEQQTGSEFDATIHWMLGAQHANMVIEYLPHEYERGTEELRAHAFNQYCALRDIGMQQYSDRFNKRASRQHFWRGYVVTMERYIQFAFRYRFDDALAEPEDALLAYTPSVHFD